MQVSGWNHKLVGHFATPAYQLDPGSQKIKVGNFGAALTGKIPPSGDDLFRDVDCLPLRIVAHRSQPFPRKRQWRKEFTPRAHVPPFARLLGSEGGR